MYVQHGQTVREHGVDEDPSGKGGLLTRTNMHVVLIWHVDMSQYMSTCYYSMSTWHISCLHETYVMLTCITRPNMMFPFMIMSTIIYHMSTCFNLHADINSWCQHACMAIMLPCTCADSEVNIYATIILVQGSPSLSSEWHRDSARGAFPDTCYGCHKFYSTVQRVSHRSLSRWISSPSSYPHVCCPTALFHRFLHVNMFYM